MEVLDEVKRLSKKLQVKPLEGDEKAVFRLLSVGTKEAARENPSAAEVYQMSAKERIMDPFDEVDGRKSKVIATSVIETKFMNGRTVNIYEPPQFIRGYCVVRSDRPEMYERLMRSKHNVSNKYRKAMGRGKDLFMLVEDKKEITDQLFLEDLRWMAETIVRNGDHLLMKSMSATLNQSPDSKLHISSYVPGVREDLQGMKLELINKAKAYPKHVITAGNDEKAKLKVQIFESMNFGVLIYENKSYHLIADRDLMKIHTPEPDKNPVDSLMEYLTSADGEKDYVRLSKLLKQALNPKA